MKRKVYVELSIEFERINDEIGNEMETLRVMFPEDLEKTKFEHNELRDELKKRPLVLNIPPLKTKMGYVLELENKLKEN